MNIQDIKPASKSELNPALGATGTLMLVLSAATPASSVFVIVPGVIAMAGTGSFLSFAIAAVVGLFMALVYAELSSAFPTTGGEYTMVGKTLGKFWGFLTFGLTFITNTLIIAVIALGVGTYLGPSIGNPDPRTLAVVTIAIAALVAMVKVNTSAFVTGLFLAVEILALLMISILGFTHIERPLSSLFTSPVVLDATTHALNPVSGGIIMAATAIALFAYNGYGAAAGFGEETHDPKKNIVKVVLWALFIIVAFEIVPLTAVLLSSPDLKDLLGAPQKIEYFLEARAGHTATVITSLAIALAIFNAVIAIVMQTARYLFSSGRDKTWVSNGLNNGLATISKRFGSPWISTAVVAVLSGAACFIDINYLLVATSATLVVIYALLCFAVIIGRKNHSTNVGVYRMPFYPMPAIIAILFLLYITYETAQDATFGMPSLIAAAVLVLVYAIYYFFFLSSRKDWELHNLE